MNTPQTTTAPLARLKQPAQGGMVRSVQLIRLLANELHVQHLFWQLREAGLAHDPATQPGSLDTILELMGVSDVSMAQLEAFEQAVEGFDVKQAAKMARELHRQLLKLRENGTTQKRKGARPSEPPEPH